jgi:hypothetical protein
MSFGGSSSNQKQYYKPALPYLQQFAKVGNSWLNSWQPNGADAAAGNAAISADVQGAGYNNPYLGAASQGIQQQAGQQLATANAASNGQAAATGMLDSNKAGQAQATNALNSSNNVTNSLNQLGSANYAAGRQLQLQAAPLALQQSQLPYQQALQIAQLYGGLGSGKSQSAASLLGTVL